MSYSEPIQFEVPGATMLDAKIAEIQDVLKTANLSWNAYSFARAYRFAKPNVDGAKVYYPAVYQAVKGDYLNVFPNDNLSSYSFVYVGQPQDLLSENNGFHNYTAKIDIIIVFQFSKIGAANPYRFTELLKYDVINQLALVPALEIKRVYDEIEECFSSFTIEEIEAKYLSDRYGALRFNCDVRYETDCEIINTY